MDVLTRMGPVGSDGDRVGGPAPALTRTAPSTRADASRVRRDFRDWITEFADDDTADDLALAVYEALANVVDHAYATARRRGEMRLWAAVSPPLTGGRDLVVTVSDDGAWRRQGDPGWRGRGLSLMRSLTRASVLTTRTGTTVQLRLRVCPAPARVPALV